MVLSKYFRRYWTTFKKPFRQVIAKKGINLAANK